VEEIEMYGTELCIANAGHEPLQTLIRKREPDPESVSHVECDGEPVDSHADGSSLGFGKTIAAGRELLFRDVFKAPPRKTRTRRSLSYEVAVAVRRLLSEFRDEYLQTTKDRLTLRARPSA
jgi:hypothetical protein